MKALIAASVIATGFAAAAHAAPVNGTGNVTPDIIFGSGNANGSFTGQTANNIEVGLRGKVRFAGVYNYDGDHTYTFDSTAFATATNRSLFNFEWSINVDQSGTSGAMLDDFSYRLEVDNNPGILTNFVTVDPFNTAGWYDHSLGNNLTANGAGIESTDNADLLANMPNYSIAQQSANMGFGWSPDPDLPGIYDFNLQVFAFGTTNVLSESSIRVLVTPLAPVPVPAALPMLASALALAGLIRHRRKA